MLGMLLITIAFMMLLLVVVPRHSDSREPDLCRGLDRTQHQHGRAGRPLRREDAEMMADDNVLVCVRCVEQPEPVKGSLRARCFLCDQPVWIGPASLINKPVNMPVVCMSCVTDCVVLTKERNAG